MDDKKYKDILLKVAVNLLDKDVEAIKFYYSKQIGDTDLERNTTPIKLIQTLEKRMLLGINNYSSFIDVLTKIGRNDLVINFFGEEKGGTGKSCLTQNLAVLLQKVESSILVIDCDPQKTTSDWAQERCNNTNVRQHST